MYDPNYNGFITKEIQCVIFTAMLLFLTLAATIKGGYK